jgi:hypothetical protein
MLCGALAVAAFFVKLGVPGLSRRTPAAVAAESEPSSGKMLGKTPRKIRFAVLGDSDSQSYHDTLILGEPGARGGAWRATTWQWTEVLAKLRGDEIDLGEWRTWGTGKYRAMIDEATGASARTPPKQDYRYDFAITGATCNQLMGLSQRQAIRLVHLMDTEPQAWRGGVVLIRIGANDVGDHAFLDELSRNPDAPGPAAVMNACVKSIRRHHPDTNLVLVGVGSNADWSGEFDSWQSAKEIANIDAGIDRFNAGLRKLAAADRRIYFLDDSAWFRSWWGQRDDHGRPRYKTLHLSPGWDITNTSGDDPHHAVLSDAHAGVVWNTLWAQRLVTSMNAAFGLHIEPITDAEVIEFLKPSFATADTTSASGHERRKDTLASRTNVQIGVDVGQRTSGQHAR